MFKSDNAPKTKSILLLLRNVLLPLCRSHSHNRLKGNTECVVITEATLVGQLLGYFFSLSRNLSPDNPSVSHTISRVVSGVKIYDYE